MKYSGFTENAITHMFCSCALFPIKIFFKKSLKILKGKTGAMIQRTDNTIAKKQGKRINNGIYNIT